MRKLTLLAALSGLAAIAQAATISLIPAGGAVAAPEGQTVGWGFNITNDSPVSWISFVASFTERFGESMFLLDSDRADAMRLFGPEAMPTNIRRRFGDFIAFPFVPATLAYLPPEKQPGHVFFAVHAGLSPEEMQVPLCIV